MEFKLTAVLLVCLLTAYSVNSAKLGMGLSESQSNGQVNFGSKVVDKSVNNVNQNVNIVQNEVNQNRSVNNVAKIKKECN